MACLFKMTLVIKIANIHGLFPISQVLFHILTYLILKIMPIM